MIPQLVHDSFKINKHKNIFLLVQGIGAYLLIIFVLSYSSSAKAAVRALDIATAPLYKLVDNFVGEDERNFFAQSDSLSILDNLCQWEENNPNFTYIIANRQPVHIDMALPADLLYTNMDDRGYKCLQVNHNFLNYFSLRVQSGRLLSEEDFSIKNDVVPILLGSKYKGHLARNQVIDLSYLGQEFKCQIVGFLAEGSYYNNAYYPQYLDEYIIFPSFTEYTIDRDNASFVLKLLLDKTNGYIASVHSANEIQQMINEKCLQLDIIPYSLEGIPNFFLSMWGLEGEQLQNILIVFSILIILSTLFSTSLNLTGKLLANRYSYSIMRINGLKRQTLEASVIIEVFLLHSAAMAAACLLSSIFMNTVILFYLLIICIIFTVLSSIMPCMLIHTMELTKIMKGTNEAI